MVNNVEKLMDFHIDKHYEEYIKSLSLLDRVFNKSSKKEHIKFYMWHLIEELEMNFHKVYEC